MPLWTGFSKEEFSGKNCNYRQLQMKTYEEMREILRSAIRRSQEENLAKSESLGELAKGLRILLTRPNIDGFKRSLMSLIETEIGKYSPFLDVLQAVARQGLSAFQSEEASLKCQASALYLLKNIMFHVEGIRDRKAEKILDDIAKANLKISDQLQNHLRLNADSGKVKSPSLIAAAILAKKRERAAQKKARRKKARKKAIEALMRQKEAEERAAKNKETAKQTHKKQSEKSSLEDRPESGPSKTSKETPPR